MDLREDFILQYKNEIYNEAATLCKAHHLRLHSIYGKRPKLVTAPKQRRWVKYREKNMAWYDRLLGRTTEVEEKLNPAQTFIALDEGLTIDTREKKDNYDQLMKN